MKNEKMKVKIKKLSDGELLIENVIVSYPNLFKPGMYEGVVKPGLDTSFIFSSDQKDAAKEIFDVFLALAKGLNPKITKLVGQVKDPKFIKSPDGESYIIKTGNPLDKPAVYFDRSGKEVHDPLSVGADKELYAGCYARIRLSLNPVMRDGKVKIWSNLSAIQFLAHGERLGGGSISSEDLARGFGEVESDMETLDEGFGDIPSDDESVSNDFDDDDFDDDDFEI